MTAKTFATVLLRTLGLWLVLDSFLRIAELLVMGWTSRSSSGSGWTSYPPLEPSISTTDLYIHDTYYVITHISAHFVSPSLKFFVGALLLFGALRFAKLLCSGLSES